MPACQKPIAAIDAPFSDRRWRAILPENAANLQPPRHQWCNDAIPSSGTRSEAVLNKLDDYPIHQTPEPIAHAATSDRNVYDRTWFNGYSGDGAYYFGIGMAIYPHRGILDCAFSVVERDGRQHCFYGSRRAPLERTDMQVGAVPTRSDRAAEADARRTRRQSQRPRVRPDVFPRAAPRFRKRVRRCGPARAAPWTRRASISSAAGPVWFGIRTARSK
jgi:hypothetical protein